MNILILEGFTSCKIANVLYNTYKVCAHIRFVMLCVMPQLRPSGRNFPVTLTLKEISKYIHVRVKL